MIDDDKKSKTPAKEKAPPKLRTSGEAPPKDKAPAEVTAEPAASSNYSRGEGQKPVSQAYKDNWNAIYAKKKKR